mgnify:FL=1
MKKLGKLCVNSGKKLEERELINLKGGEPICWCYCGLQLMGRMSATNEEDCDIACSELGEGCDGTYSWI